MNRNALVAAPSCRASRAALPFAETARSQGEGCRGATSISPLWLSVSCSSFVLLADKSPTVLSAATVVGNVLALDCWSQIAFPLFQCPLFPFSSLEI